MKRKPKHEDASLPQQDELDIAGVIAKIQQQLVNIENKLDSLISRPKETPFKGEQQFSKPFRGFDRFRGRENRGQGNDFRERRLFKVICAECNKECEVPFKPTGDRPVYCKECFSRRKQGGSFNGERDRGHGIERDFTQKQYSDKKRGRKNQPDSERKSVSRRRKGRV